MFRPFPLFSLIECFAFFFRSFGFWFGIALCCSHFAAAKKVSPSVIVASIEGEVSSLNLEDEFKVQLGPTTVGKKINPKTILTTGKTGKVVLLFSNGTLITIKPGSRFYLRTYKQLEGIAEGTVDPGKLEEEPTQSELSAHLDFGDLVVKAPKLKKGSSMKLTSPLGTAGIRGTMFQLMAVRNSVTGDIMGGINLISGDIDFTDTGGNMVSLLSGQSIQLATSKLGAPVASQTGELVDLASTYGPALTDGFAPPPLESVFVDYSEVGPAESGEDPSSDSLFPTMPTVARTSISAVNSAQGWEMIHELATDLFFEIESSENVASGFTFESMALAPTIDIPTPEPETPVAPPSVTGETLAGADLEFFQGGHPELKLLGTNNSTDPLVKIFNNGARMQVEMRAPSEGITWRKIDPWVKAFDFLGNDITSGVQITGTPDILLANVNAAENEAPEPGASVSYEVSYIIRDLRGLNTVTFRQVDVVATRPTIEIANKQPSFPWNELDLDGDGKPYDSFYQWVSNQVTVQDVRGESLAYSENQKPGSFYLSGEFDLSKIGTFNGLKVVAIDWRGLRSESDPFTMQVTSPEKLPVLSTTSFVSNFPALQGEENLLEYGDPSNELGAWLNGATAVDVEGNPVDVTYKISENEALSPLEIDDIFPGSGNRLGYTIVFEAVDPRWEAGGSDPLMKDQLTVSETQAIEVVATPPKLELIFHNPREGLGVSDNQDEIRYLVRSKENVAEFPDDGDFAIAQDSGENNRQDRKLYFKATAYNGFGTDITDQVNISYDVPVDSSILNESSTITVKVNDQPVRGTTEGAETVLAPRIKIIDVIAPILNFPSGQANPFVVEGIMPELALLNGSSKDQVTGNTDSDYYFNDPGIEIIDNYYTRDELHTHNGIDDSKNYTFEYTNVNDASDTSAREVFNPVFEYGQDRIQTDLDMAKIGDYTLTYSLSDPSENIATLTRSITVKDTQAPVVKLYGSKTMYVDLQAIFDGESRYYDPGAFAVENLYKSENGFFDWLVDDDDMAWSFTIQVCNDLEADTYGDAVPADKDFIASTIDGLADSPPTETIRYRFNYVLQDRAGNDASNFRTVELRGSPNLYPSVFFLLSHPDSLDGIPSNEYIDDETTPPTATLPTLIWEIEVGENEYSQAPEARVFTDLGGGQQENLDNAYSVDLIYINQDGNEISSQNVHLGGVSNFPDGSTFFSRVNYWNSAGDFYFVSDDPGSYAKHLSTSDEWRKVVLRYSVENSLGNKSVRDIEVRLMDTTPPFITKNTFSGNTIEVGVPFQDPGVTVSDLANSGISETTTIDLSHPQGLDDNATFVELAERGFWASGDYTITYNAVDEFGNQAEAQVLNLSVIDTKEPHVSPISFTALSVFRESFSDLSSNLLAFTGTFDESYPDPADLFKSLNPQSIANILGGTTNVIEGYDYAERSFERGSISEPESFYVREDVQNGQEIIILRASQFMEYSDTGRTQVVNDSFGRSYIWHSPFKIKLENNNGDQLSIEDPGILVYESSIELISYEPTILQNNLRDQIQSISIGLNISQENFLSTTIPSDEYRMYKFLDDIKPVITITPETNLIDTFILAEAGEEYNDETGSYYKWINGSKTGPYSAGSRNVVVDDLIDENLPFYRSYFKVTDEQNESVTGIDEFDLGGIYTIRYDANDTEVPPNSAIPKYRTVIVKDTLSPVINWNPIATYEVNSTSEFVKDINETRKHLLQALSFTAVDENNFDQNLSYQNDFSKWSVEFDPSFIERNDAEGQSGVYPLNRESSGYTVTVSVTDASGNQAETVQFELKVGDYAAPEVSFIGDEVIHDFLRFKGNDSFPQEKLFDEQDDSKLYDSTGVFQRGAHRLLLANYDFVDPGVWAEDESFPSNFPDVNPVGGNGKRESYAIRKTDTLSDIENPPEEGIIYAYSVKYNNAKSLSYYQNLFENGFSGSDPGPTDPNATRIPDVTGGGNDPLVDVHEINIKYSVKDGWGNISPIKTRYVYIYESDDYAGSVFYATPLFTLEGDPFKDYYDTNRTTFGIDNPFLSNIEKDYDGDGVSDYWETILGFRPDDANDKPNTSDLENPAYYKDKVQGIPNGL